MNYFFEYFDINDVILVQIIIIDRQISSKNWIIIAFNRKIIFETKKP
jgi:hypothetical protein